MEKSVFIVVGWIAMGYYFYLKTSIPRELIKTLRIKQFSLLNDKHGDVDREKVSAYEAEIQKERIKIRVAVVMYLVACILSALMIIYGS